MRTTGSQMSRISQQGSVLLLSLFMLMIMTMLALSAIRMGTVNLRTINNMQMRGEAMTAAQLALDEVLSSNFTENISGTGRIWTVPIDAGKSYDVVVAVPCIRQVTPILNTVLDLGNPEDAKCFDSIGGGAISACSTTVWEISATARSGWFGGRVTMTQGTGIRMDNGAATAYANTTGC
ncbi:MAG: pilus assembly PilX N-terminal domain-containing protein [Sulfuritalea sp.]|nr:pilus assembly PilX N-terminal domain-containing protein [Sulfuritalea sp.]